MKQSLIFCLKIIIAIGSTILSNEDCFQGSNQVQSGRTGSSHALYTVEKASDCFQLCSATSFMRRIFYTSWRPYFKALQMRIDV